MRNRLTFLAPLSLRRSSRSSLVRQIAQAAGAQRGRHRVSRASSEARGSVR